MLKILASCFKLGTLGSPSTETALFELGVQGISLLRFLLYTAAMVADGMVPIAICVFVMFHAVFFNSGGAMDSALGGDLLRTSASIRAATSGFL